MKLPFFVSVLVPLVISGCSDNDPSNSNPAAVNILLGRWVDTYVTVDCDTIITFINDNTFSVTSASSRQSGIYMFSALESEAGAYFLELDFVEDNGLTNCDGEQGVDTSGLDTTVKFPDNNTMTWSFGGDVAVTFERAVDEP